MTTLATLLSLFAAVAVVTGGVTAALAGPELARSIAGGDARALRNAYDAYAGRVLALALRIVRSRAEAEDVVQDTFLEVWRRAEEYDPMRGEFSAWITSMARSRCIDRVRRARVRARYAETDTPVEPAAGPDERAASQRDGARVRELLTSLPTEQRAALELAFFDGLTQQQIAERTGAPLGTVKTRLRLALEKLSPQLEALR
jgi:RNA polymerase sigma-70 factor, ECF subfamily